MMQRVIFALALAIAAPVSAQRHVDELPELDDYSLSSLITGEQHRIEACATRTDASSYVATVQARVSPGRMPATLFNSPIHITVVSRPRDGDFEACVRRSLIDVLRHAEFAVGSSVRARHTFQIAERPDPPIDQRPPAYSEQEVRMMLSRSTGSLQQCLRLAGIPETVTLRIAVRPDGQLVLTSADVPPGSSGNSLSCLSSRVSSMRVSGRPSRTVSLVYQLGVARHAFE